MRWRLLLIALAATPAAAQSMETRARDFAARQEAAWNAGRLDRYFSGFTPDAVFTDQAYVGDKPPVPYGTSTLAEARANAHRAFATRPWPREAGRVLRVETQAGQSSVRVVSVVGSVVWEKGRARRLCATRVQVLSPANGELRASSQTDTYVRCRGG